MNLKAAANQLGVHYQTAYKWVRSGALTAIRVGGRYEVSDAAIEQFSARRGAILLEPLPAGHDPGPSDVTPEDVLEELEAMAMDPFVGARATATFAARRGAQILGDLCAVVCFDLDGSPWHIAIDHPNPAHAAFIRSAIETFGPATTTPGFAFSAFSEQRLIRLSHVPQDLVREQIRPELRQHIAINPIRCLLSVPVVANGKTCGAITFTRGMADRPYSDADEAFAVQMSTRLGVLAETAADVGRALALRSKIVEALRLRLEFNPSEPVASEADLTRLLDDCGATIDISAAILDDQRRYLAVSQAIRVIEGLPGELIGTEDASMTHPDDREAERASFEPLTSGELDFLDINIRRVLPDGRELAYASHRAAVRAPDASLRYFVKVARPLRLPEADYPSVVPLAYRPAAADIRR